MPSRLTRRLVERFYPSANYIDDNTIFYRWIEESIGKGSLILDIGAGAGVRWPYWFTEIGARVVGIDTDHRVTTNPNLSTSICADFHEYDFEKNSFDIVFANNVAEHIDDPRKFLLKIQTILKPSGYFFFKCPNKWHYVALASRYTPFWFHVFYNRLRGRLIEDIFPTYYRMNSKKVLQKLADEFNLRLECRYFEGRPAYLTINPALFLIGVAYERIVNTCSQFNRFKAVLMAKMQFIEE